MASLSSRIGSFVNKQQSAYSPIFDERSAKKLKQSRKWWMHQLDKNPTAAMEEIAIANKALKGEPQAWKEKGVRRGGLYSYNPNPESLKDPIRLPKHTKRTENESPIKPRTSKYDPNMKSIAKSIDDFIAKFDASNAFAIATAQSKKSGHSDFSEGSKGRAKRDEIAEAIKKKHHIKIK